MASRWARTWALVKADGRALTRSASASASRVYVRPQLCSHTVNKWSLTNSVPGGGITKPQTSVRGRGFGEDAAVTDWIGRWSYVGFFRALGFGFGLGVVALDVVGLGVAALVLGLASRMLLRLFLPLLI